MNRVQIAATVNTHPVRINISAKTEVVIGIVGITANGWEIQAESVGITKKNKS